MQMNQKTSTKWKCSVCNHIFEADQQKECPECNAADFKVKEYGSNKPKKGVYEM